MIKTHNKLTDEQKSDVFDYLLMAQANLTKRLEHLEPNGKFTTNSWEKPGLGFGKSCVLRGNTVEKTGVNISKVSGEHYPSVDEKYKDKPFFATGISTITHMYNPYAPIGHMNVRLLEVEKDFWVGGGADLTPLMVFEEDTKEFHKLLKDGCDRFSSDAYEKYAKWCDEYFYITHRKSSRGVGGVFFDYLQGDFQSLFSFIKDICNAYIEIYPNILARRLDTAFTSEEKEKQLYWRGRYVEFNLLYDRGTKFGLLSGGNPDNIFVSLPPEVKW